MSTRFVAALLGLVTTAFVLTGPTSAVAQSDQGDVFGDLVHIKRDAITGQPILQERWVEMEGGALGWDYCPIPVDSAGVEIPFAPLSCDPDPAQASRLVEVDYFGRLSAARTKERNQRMHFDEVIVNINGADLVDVDEGRRAAREAEALAEMQRATRNYAKRQVTWFRREPTAEWVTVRGDEWVDSLAASIVARLAAAAAATGRPRGDGPVATVGSGG